jgi:hypothetical protein
MAFSRYHNTPLFLNDNRQYKNVFFRNRDINETFQYDLSILRYPSAAAIANFTNVSRIWSATDTLYNLSNEYYGDPQYWWIIAFYNKKASEPEFEVGDLYFIPLPLEDMLGYF